VPTHPRRSGRIEAFLKEWPDAEYGPAHVVLSDKNLEDHWIDGCIAALESRDPHYFDPPWPSDAECAATVDFLRSLLDVPEDARCPVDGGYEGDDDADG
jgi:hypothetical protein